MTQSTSVAVYPGTFDPITNGHLDILERALRLFHRVIVTVASNQRKHPLFTVDERIAFIKDAMTQSQMVAEDIRTILALLLSDNRDEQNAKILSRARGHIQ